MRFAFPISKTEQLEDGRLLIEGVATSEALDCQGDILDYEGSKRAFMKWRGNIREQHDPKKAVGRAIEVIPDDEAKTITVRAFVSKGAWETQEKILDKTLADFSVGGGKPTRTKTEKSGVRRVLDWPMSELSIVDVGANPETAVSVTKAAGIEEEDPEKPPVEEEKPEVDPAESAEVEQTPKEKSEEPVQLSEAQMVELVTKITDAVLAAIEAKKADDPASTPAPTPEQKPPEKSVPEPVIQKTDGMAAWDIRSALDCLSGLECLRANEAYETMAGIPEPPEQLTLLDAAIKALKGFVASEAKELLEGDGAATEPAMKSAGRVVIVKMGSSADAELVQKYTDIMARFDALEAIQKSAPPPDPRLDDVVSGIGSISKTVGDLQAGGESHAGEIKALRKSMDQILSMPVPGRSPLRNLEAAREQIQKAAPSETNKASIARELAQGAPTTVREYLLHEASLLSRG